MCAFDQPPVLEPFEVSPDGRFRHIQQITKVGRRGYPVAGQESLYPFTSLSWDESFAHYPGLYMLTLVMTQIDGIVQSL